MTRPMRSRMAMTPREAHDCASEVIRRMMRLTRRSEGTPLRDQIEGKCKVRTVHIVQGCNGDANVVQFPDTVTNVWTVSLTPPSPTHPRTSSPAHDVFSKRFYCVISISN